MPHTKYAPFLLATLTLLASCSNVEPTVSSSETAVTPSASASANAPVDERAEFDPKAVVNFFGFSSARYIPLEETEDLAEIRYTQAGITGSIVGFTEGPSYYTDGGPNSGNTVIMRVKIEEEFVGDTPNERSVDVLLNAPPENGAEDFAEVLPIGADVVLYLQPAQDLPPDEAAGLMIPISPQGFVVGDGTTDGIVYPLAHEIESNESLDEQVP